MHQPFCRLWSARQKFTTFVYVRCAAAIPPLCWVCLPPGKRYVIFWYTSSMLVKLSMITFDCLVRLSDVSCYRYKSRSYRSRTIREPRKVLAEFGTHIPPEVAIHVHDSTADCRYLVLPLRPAGTDGWSEERLRGLITRDSMIGVTVLRALS